MTPVAEQTGAWLEQLPTSSRRPVAQPLRERGLRRFTELGFPTTHDEEWRFTNVAPIARATFTPRGGGAGAKSAQGPIPAGVRQRAPGRATRQPAEGSGDRQAGDDGVAEGAPGQVRAFEQNAFMALNTAFLTDGAFMRVARGTVVEQPIEIVFGVGAAGRWRCIRGS